MLISAPGKEQALRDFLFCPFFPAIGKRSQIKLGMERES
jgi:hypothetical protein